MYDEFPAPEFPPAGFWIRWTGVALVVIFAVFFLVSLFSDADAGEVPLPRPKPVQATTCISIADTYKVIGAVETRGLGTVEYIAGEDLRFLLDVYNQIPPISALQATSAIIITPNRPVRLSAGGAVPAGAHDLRMFLNGCQVSRDVFSDTVWQKIAKIIDKVAGTPV